MLPAESMLLKYQYSCQVLLNYCQLCTVGTAFTTKLLCQASSHSVRCSMQKILQETAMSFMLLLDVEISVVGAVEQEAA